MDACDENIASNLQQKMAVIHCNWSYLLQYAEKYGSDTTLNRASFDEEMKQLDSWLIRAHKSLNYIRKFTKQEINEAYNEISQITSEVSEMETLFKSLSRRFQALVSEMAMPEIEDTMRILKNQKEHLVNVRSILPLRQEQLGETLKNVEKIDEKIVSFQNSASLLFHSDENLEVKIQQIETLNNDLNEFVDKGFDVQDIETELKIMKNHLLEAQTFQKSKNRQEILRQKFHQYCQRLQALLANSSSNLLEMMVILLNMLILSKQGLLKEDSSLTSKVVEETLKYIQDAQKENRTNLTSDFSDTKLTTDLKILARSDLEQILCSISQDEKTTILAILDILLNLTKDCSEDIAATYTSLTSLRYKILCITVIHETDEDDDDEDDSEMEDQIDPEIEAARAQLAKDTTFVSRPFSPLLALNVSFRVTPS